MSTNTMPYFFYFGSSTTHGLKRAHRETVPTGGGPCNPIGTFAGPAIEVSRCLDR
jgi:hypothetical protein